MNEITKKYTDCIVEEDDMPIKLKIDLPAGSCGIGKHLQFVKLEHNNPLQMTLEYEVYFEDNFKSNKGGKLPGLYISRQGTLPKTLNAEKTTDKDASIRLMWGKDMTGHLYVYSPTRRQDASYYAIPKSDNSLQHGDSLYQGVFSFQKGVWNRVKIFVKMNDIVGKETPLKNGVFSVKVNDTEKVFSKMVWRLYRNVGVNTLLWDICYGTHDESYACPSDTSIYIRNLCFS